MGIFRRNNDINEEENERMQEETREEEASLITEKAIIKDKE